MPPERRYPVTGEHIVVVGAGIAGLSAAFRLQRAGFDVHVLESDAHVGGRMRTIERDGFRLDTNAQFLNTSYTEMIRLIRDAGLQDEIAPTSDVIGVVRDGQVHRLRNSSYLDKVRSRLLSNRGRLGMGRALLDSYRARRSLDYYDLSQARQYDTGSLHDYAIRRLGEEVLDYVVEPMSASAFLRPATDISPVGFLWTLPKFYSGSFFNSATGIGFVPTGLASQLRVTVGARVADVEEVRDGGALVTWVSRDDGTERTESAAGVVITVSGHQMLAMYPQLHPTQREVVSEMTFARAMTVHVALHRAPSEPSVLLSFPRSEHGLTSLTFHHNKAPGRAPKGKGLISGIWYEDWADKRWDLDDADITQEVIASLAAAVPGLIDEADIAFTNIERCDPAVMVAPPGVYHDLHRFQQSIRCDIPVQLAGDYFAVGTTNASLCSGELAAERTARRLGTTLGLGIPA
jgi:oxygen-dependent protoporphyrinogen oxidase